MKSLDALRAQYGDHLFEKDADGYYTCFFEGCGESMKGNFQRHLARHEELGHRVDSEQAEQRREAHIASRLQMMREERAVSVSHSATPAVLRDVGPRRACTHDDHDVLWPDLPRLQPVDAFYSHSSKCKKCYIHLQSERMRRQRAGFVPGMRDEGPRRAPRREHLPQQQMASIEVLPFLVPEVDEHQPEVTVADVGEDVLFAVVGRVAGEEGDGGLADALLGLPFTRAKRATVAGVGPAHAATAACWGRAVLQEVREHPYAWGARAELEGLDVDVEQGSLRQLETALVRSLTAAMHRNAGRIESAHINALIVHVRKRIQHARLQLRLAATPASSLCGGCGASSDPRPGNGAPVFCAGLCGRVFHATCAGNPDESGWECDQCRARTTVLHFDSLRNDWYSLVREQDEQRWEARGPFLKTEDRSSAPTLGRVLRLAKRNELLAVDVAAQEEEEQDDDVDYEDDEEDGNNIDEEEEAEADKYDGDADDVYDGGVDEDDDYNVDEDDDIDHRGGKKKRAREGL